MAFRISIAGVELTGRPGEPRVLQGSVSIAAEASERPTCSMRTYWPPGSTLAAGNDFILADDDYFSLADGEPFLLDGASVRRPQSFDELTIDYPDLPIPPVCSRAHVVPSLLAARRGGQHAGCRHHSGKPAPRLRRLGCGLPRLRWGVGSRGAIRRGAKIREHDRRGADERGGAPGRGRDIHACRLRAPVLGGRWLAVRVARGCQLSLAADDAHGRRD